MSYNLDNKFTTKAIIRLRKKSTFFILKTASQLGLAE